jgi:hypothetical protein
MALTQLPDRRRDTGQEQNKRPAEGASAAFRGSKGAVADVAGPHAALPHGSDILTYFNGGSLTKIKASGAFLCDYY